MSDDAPRARGRTELAALGLPALVLIVADQLTKAMVAGGLEVGERLEVIGDLVVIWHLRNSGAAFSLFQGGLPVFLAVSAVALGLITYFHLAFRGRGPWPHAILGVILAGTVGNLIDRIRFGYVTDFVSIGAGDLRWPAFNVADSSLVVGILALVAYLTIHDARHRAARA